MTALHSAPSTTSPRRLSVLTREARSAFSAKNGEKAYALLDAALSEIGTLASSKNLVESQAKKLLTLLRFYSGENVSLVERWAMRGCAISDILRGRLGEIPQSLHPLSRTYHVTNAADILRDNTECTFAAASRLWSITVENLLPRALRMTAKELRGFARASALEKLDGVALVFDAEHGRSTADLARLVDTTLRALHRYDSVLSPFGNPAKPQWEFIFQGVVFYALAFGNCYPRTHSRFSFHAGKTILLLQPQSAFNRRSNGSRLPEPVRGSIRSRYHKSGRSYLTHNIETPVKARSFVLPVDDTRPFIAWWETGK